MCLETEQQARGGKKSVEDESLNPVQVDFQNKG